MCRYDFASEFEEAVGHALDRGTNTKVLLRMPEAGLPSESEAGFSTEQEASLSTQPEEIRQMWRL